MSLCVQLGLQTLPEDLRVSISSQHAALITVRPNAALYAAVSDILCKVCNELVLHINEIPELVDEVWHRIYGR